MTEFDQNQENNQSMEDAMKSVQEVKVGDVVKGEVLVIEDKQVIVGIEGAGVEGVVPAKELSTLPVEDISEVVKVGDVLDLVVISTIGKFGKISKEISKRARSSKHLLQMLSKAV